MRSLQALLSALGLVLALVAGAAAAPLAITGQVTYPEKIDLPAGARLEVRLFDLSRHDTRPTLEATAPISPTGRLPLQFTLSFDSDVVIPSHRYGLGVAITSAGQTWFRNAEPYPVDPLDPAAAPMVTVHFTGTITNAPAGAPEPLPAPVSILDVHWRVTALSGKPVPAEPPMTLLITNDSRAGGRGGCNNYFAQAEIEPPKLAFSAVAATRMMCAGPVMANETAFFDALPTVVGYTLIGTTLTLVDASGRPVITLIRSAAE